MCIYGEQMCICISNMKFLWQGEVCTDDDANADDANDDGQSMIKKAFWLINQMSQKCYEPIKATSLLHSLSRSLFVNELNFIVITDYASFSVFVSQKSHSKQVEYMHICNCQQINHTSIKANRLEIYTQ